MKKLAAYLIFGFIFLNSFILVRAQEAEPENKTDSVSAGDASNTNQTSVDVRIEFGFTGPPAGTTATVDFGVLTYELNDGMVGSTISTYTGGGSANILKSEEWKRGLKGLGPLAWRVPLRYNDGQPGSSAGGAQTIGDGADYIKAIKEIGGVPIIVVGGKESDNDFTPEDAAGLVHYFNDNGGQNGGPVSQWIIGNEYTNPDNDPIGYQKNIRAVAEAMKLADPTIKLSAPAIPDMVYGEDAIAETVKNAGEFLDYIGYHSYQGKTAGLTGTGDYKKYADYYRFGYIIEDYFGERTEEIIPSLEEFNWHPFYEGDTEFYDWQNTVFTASVIGNSLSAGGRAIHYSDSNGPLGLMNDGSGLNDQPGELYTKFPAYWGLGMWTGLNGKFKIFGENMVATSSQLPDVEIFASDNGKIIAINKDAENDQFVTIGLGSVMPNGFYDIWQTSKRNPLDPPKQIADDAPYNGSMIPLNLPAGTVSSIDLRQLNASQNQGI